VVVVLVVGPFFGGGGGFGVVGKLVGCGVEGLGVL